jgi:hypothetical protein
MSSNSEINPDLCSVRAFERTENCDDRAFSAVDRLAAHLDEEALSAVEEVIEALIVDE